MADVMKAVLASCATAAIALSMTACGGSSTSSTASSAASAVESSASAAAAPAEEGTLASMCTDIDAIMMGNPDADPAGTAQALEAIKAKITTSDAELVEKVAAAYSAVAANPADAEADSNLSAAASALGAGCESATTAPKPN